MKVRYHLFVITLILFLIVAFLIPQLTFFISDVGLRFLQVRELIANNWQTFAITYKALPFDPELAHVPYYFAYSIIDGDIYLQITPFLPLLASGFYALLGPIGLAVVPIFGTVLTAVAVYQLAKITEIPHAKWLLWFTVFATPLFFYTFELWDHTIAAACAIWTVVAISYAIVKQKLLPAFLGGIILGIGLGQRPEMYVFAIAIGVASLFTLWPNWRITAVTVVGSLIGVIPIWILQYRWVGHPLGMALAPHLFKYGVPTTYPFEGFGIGFSRPVTIGRFLIYIRSHDPITFSAILLILFGLIIIIMSLRQAKWRTPRNLTLGLILSLAGYTIYAVLALQFAALNGLITTFPLLALSFAFVPKTDDNGRYRAIYNFVITTSTLFLLLMLIFWPASGGLQWSTRYLLPVIPLLLYVAAYAIHAFDQVVSGKTRQAYRRLVIGLLGMMLLIQLSGFKMQLNAHQEAKQIHTYLNNLPADIILTNAPFMPAHISNLEDKTFIYVADDADTAKMIAQLSQNGVRLLAVFPLEFIPISVPDQVGNFTVHSVQNHVYNLEEIK